MALFRALTASSGGSGGNALAKKSFTGSYPTMTVTVDFEPKTMLYFHNTDSGHKCIGDTIYDVNTDTITFVGAAGIAASNIQINGTSITLSNTGGNFDGYVIDLYYC